MTLQDQSVQSSNPQLQEQFQKELDRAARVARNVDKVPTLGEAWQSIVKVFHQAIDGD